MNTESIKPFFSIVIPLYNKEKNILDTINTVLGQSFQDFEIVVVNDGSKDNGPEIVSNLSDSRIRIIHQENAGVSSARNTGVKESTGEYIALLDADDLWLENHLQNIHELIKKYPDFGLYACAYKIRIEGAQDRSINVYGLPDDSDFVTIPNYFESVAYGDNLVCSSAVCIPKKIFIENDIWFPVGEKYGEDQYVWARVAVQFEIAYCKIASAIYDQSAENNTIGAILEETEPHQSFYMIKELRGFIVDEKVMKGFDDYLSKIFFSFPLRNMLYRSKIYGFKQIFIFPLNVKHVFILVFILVTPKWLVKILKMLKSKFF